MTDFADQLKPFHAMDILARARHLEAEGRSICHLEVGEPSSSAAPAVLAAADAALGLGQPYTPATGIAPLREAISRHYFTKYGAAVDPGVIVATTGSSAGFLLAFLAAFEPGARIAVTRPGYPAYLNILYSLGFQPVEIEVTATHDWKLSADAVRDAYRKGAFAGLLFASPANPTGATVEPAEFAAIVAACDDLGVRLISDEIYHGLTYGVAETTAAALHDDAIVINSFSKYYCMTGWRIGWMVVPPALLARVTMLQQNFFISAPTLSQIAAQAAFGEVAYFERVKARYLHNRSLLNEGLRRIGFDVTGDGQGAFYTVANVQRFTNSSMAFCRQLLEEAGVATAPGLDFDRANGETFLRFSYAGSTETVVEALSRLEAFLG